MLFDDSAALSNYYVSILSHPLLIFFVNRSWQSLYYSKFLGQVGDFIDSYSQILKKSIVQVID